MLLKPLESGFRILCTLSFSTNAENQRCVVFCSHGHNFETQCGDPMPVEWSTCQLSENATCGQGIRTRLLSCVRSDGKPVSVDQCEQVSCVYLYPTPMALFVCCFFFFEYWSATSKMLDINDSLISSHHSLGSVRVEVLVSCSYISLV